MKTNTVFLVLVLLSSFFISAEVLAAQSNNGSNLPAILADLQKQEPSTLTPTEYLTEKQMDEIRGESWNWRAAYYLVRVNMAIYGNLGWEIGRYQGIRRYGVDVGPWPGWANQGWITRFNW